MKHTYNGTLFHEDLTEATFKLLFHEGLKYTVEPFKAEEFKGVKSWDLIEGGKEAELIEAMMDEVDEHHEYLVLHFTDGSVRAYRNSHVTMFVW